MEGIYHTILPEIIFPEHSTVSSSSQPQTQVQPCNQKTNKLNKKLSKQIGFNGDEDIFANYAAFKDIPNTTSNSTLSSLTSTTSTKNGKSSSSSMNFSQQSRDENNPGGRGKGRGRGRGRGRGKGKKEFENVNTSVGNYSEELEPNSRMDTEETDSSAFAPNPENVPEEHSSIALKNIDSVDSNDNKNILMADKNFGNDDDNRNRNDHNNNNNDHNNNDNNSNNFHCNALLSDNNKSMSMLVENRNDVLISMRNTNSQDNDNVFSSSFSKPCLLSDSSSVLENEVKKKSSESENIILQVNTTFNTTSISTMSFEVLKEEIATLDEVRMYLANFFENCEYHHRTIDYIIVFLLFILYYFFS